MQSSDPTGQGPAERRVVLGGELGCAMRELPCIDHDDIDYKSYTNVGIIKRRWTYCRP